MIILLISLVFVIQLYNLAINIKSKKDKFVQETKIDALIDAAMSQQSYSRLNAEANKEIIKAMTSSIENQKVLMLVQQEILRRQNNQ